MSDMPFGDFAAWLAYPCSERGIYRSDALAGEGPYKPGEVLPAEHDSPETAYIEYWRIGECPIRYWIETTGRGQRVHRQVASRGTHNAPTNNRVWLDAYRSKFMERQTLYVHPETGEIFAHGLPFRARKAVREAYARTYPATHGKKDARSGE